MSNLDQFLNQDLSANDVTHSNGYGVVAGGGGAGGMSMEQRRQLQNRPRIVGEYKFSHFGRRGSSIKSRTADGKAGRAYDPNTDTFSDDAKYSNRQAAGIKDNRQIDQKSIDRRQHFIEPPTRNYDKYS